MLPSRRCGSAVGSLCGLSGVDLEVRLASFDHTFKLTSSLGTGDPQGSVLFSGKREGFALYFARLVRPIWGSKVTVVK